MGIEELIGLFRRLRRGFLRSEEHTSELQSQSNLVCRLLLEKKKKHIKPNAHLKHWHASVASLLPAYRSDHHTARHAALHLAHGYSQVLLLTLLTRSRRHPC